MQHLLELALSFPTVVYTVLLGVSLVYWTLVLVGAAKVELAGDGALEGADVGGGHHEIGDVGGAHDGVGHHDVGGDGDVDVDVGDSHAGMLAALKLRSAPLTVVLGCIVLFAWIESMIAMQIWDGTIAKVATLVMAPLLALFPTSIAIRPLARFFVPAEVTRHHQLVGKVCRIRTGHVDAGFGEATLEDGGAGLVVRVRIDVGDSGEKLKRGDQAIIVDYDAEKQEFMVAPFDDLEVGEGASKRHSSR